MTILEVKAYMKAHNITYQELSDRSRIPLNTLKNIFAGYTKHPRTDTWDAIIKALGLSNEEPEYTEDVKKNVITFDKSVNRRTYGLKTWEVTSTKAEKTCTIPVCEVVQAEIKRYKPQKDGNFYFGGKEPLAPATVDRHFKRYTELAGLPQIRIHDLRHSFVSLCIHLGADVFTIAELISDNVEQVHKTYGHLYPQAMTDILAKIKIC
jgi:integrase